MPENLLTVRSTVLYTHMFFLGIRRDHESVPLDPTTLYNPHSHIALSLYAYLEFKI